MLLERDHTRPPVLERTHVFTDMPVSLRNGSTIPARELASRIYDDKIGIAMLEQPVRYSVRFGYDRDTMQYDNGHDLCPVGHQLELPYHIARVIEAEIIEGTVYGSLSEEEIGLLMFIGLVHDMGESTHPSIEAAGLTVVGDIPAGLKTDQDRLHEAAIRKFIYATFFSDVEPAVLENVEAIISHEDRSILHELFEAGHLAQTLETANFAYYALAREQSYREGEVIDISSENGARLSGLLGIARVAYTFAQKDVKKYEHLSYISSEAQLAYDLRHPQHTLIN